MRNACRDVQKSKYADRPLSPKYLIPGLPLIPPPTTFMQTISWRSFRISSPPPATEHESYTHAAGQQRSVAHNTAISRALTKEGQVSARVASLASLACVFADLDPWAWIDSSSALTYKLDKLRTGKTITAIQKHCNRSISPLPPRTQNRRELHRRQYSHIVRTEALAPSGVS